MSWAALFSCPCSAQSLSCIKHDLCIKSILCYLFHLSYVDISKGTGQQYVSKLAIPQNVWYSIVNYFHR